MIYIINNIITLSCSGLVSRLRGSSFFRGGLTCAVHDEVAMGHFERQSQQAPGIDWRQNLTTVNAWTFSECWGHAVAGAACPPGGVLNLS